MKPILFNSEMVRAILDGRKTVTRRVAFKADELREFPCALYPDGWWFRGRVYASREKAMSAAEGIMRLCKYHPGDILWVRETWAEMPYGFVYRADDENPEGWEPDDRWRPSIHMPREAARLFLRITDVQVERLLEITEDGAKAEGAVKSYPYTDPETGKTAFMLDEKGTYRSGFLQIWDITIKPSDRPTYGWDANPWVWVVSFERISKDEAQA